MDIIDNYIKQKEHDAGTYFTQKVKLYQSEYKFEMTHNTGHNDEADAFRHAFMQGCYSRKNELGAKIIGDYHERDELKPKNYTWEQYNKERNMDLWNNEVGRQANRNLREKLGLKYYTMSQEEFEDLLAAEIFKQMRKGKLITDLNDKRKFNENKLKGQHTGDAINIAESNPHQQMGVLNSNDLTKDNFLKNSGLGRDDYNNLLGFSKDFNISNANFRPAESFNSDFLKAIGLTPQEYDNLFDFTQRVQERPSRPQSENAFHNQFLKDIGLTQEQYDNLFDFTQRVHISDADFNKLCDKGINNSFVQDSSPPPNMMPSSWMLDSGLMQVRQSLLSRGCPTDLVDMAMDKFSQNDSNLLNLLLSANGLSSDPGVMGALANAANLGNIVNTFDPTGLIGDFNPVPGQRMC